MSNKRKTSKIAKAASNQSHCRKPTTKGKRELEKRLLLSQTESRAMDRLVSSLASELGTPVKLSHVLRACTSLLLHSEGELIQRARESGRLMRPPNGDMQALIQFEKSIAALVSAAIKDAGPIR